MIPAQTRKRRGRIEEGTSSVEERMELVEKAVEDLVFRGWDKNLLGDFLNILHRCPVEFVRHCLNGHFRTEKRSNPLWEHGILERVAPPGSEKDQVLEAIRPLLQASYRAGVHNYAVGCLRERIARERQRV